MEYILSNLIDSTSTMFEIGPTGFVSYFISIQWYIDDRWQDISVRDRKYVSVVFSELPKMFYLLCYQNHITFFMQHTLKSGVA